ncbi:MAG: GNAT family N-acetyltransferase [Chloroflexota bacterium]
MLGLFSHQYQHQFWKNIAFENTNSQKITLRSGETIHIRQISAHDGDWIRELYTGLSPQSCNQRFNTSFEVIAPSFVEKLAQQTAFDAANQGYGLLILVDDRSHLLGMRPVAIGRYVTSGAKEAEVAFTVADDYQGLGLGSLLMKRLIKQAKKSMISTLSAYVQPNNVAMQSLIIKSNQAASLEHVGSMLHYQLYL